MPTRERPKSPEVQTPGNTPTRKQRSISPSVAKRNIEQRRQPGNVYVPRKKTPPRGVRPAATKSLVAPGLASNTVSGAADIVELARALRNDVDLIFEFVYNNIEFIPTFGSQKGGLGALIDGMGNAFDQSELMVELLREAGYTCSFQNGEIEITEAAAMAWLGTDSIWSSTNLLGTVGIPNEAFWTGTEWKLRVSHCWVQVDISGTDYVFDPAMKSYTVVPASIDLDTALDYDRTDFMNDATSGATITSDYVENLNRTNVRDNLATMTGNLVDYLKTNAPTATLNDVIGGRTINPVTAPIRQTSLPYLRPSSTPDTWSDIPNAYKATLGVFYDDGLDIDVSFYSKDIHGKRLTLTFNGNRECELRLDGVLVATSAAQAADSWNSVYLSITHPYAETWWDQGFWQSLWEGHPYLIAQAWGNAGRQMVEIHRAKLSQSLFDGVVETDESVIGETLALWFNHWNAEKSWAANVFNRMTNCTTVLQHQVGLIGHFDTPTMDLGGIMWSTYCLENDEWPDPIDTNDTALAMHGIAFEAGSIEQTCRVGGISTTTIIDKAVQDGLKIYDGRGDNWTTNVRPNLSNYDSGTLDFIYNVYINAPDPWRVALPEDGEVVRDDFIGYGFYAISPWYGALGIFSGYLQGGMGSTRIPVGGNTGMVYNVQKSAPTGGVGTAPSVDVPPPNTTSGGSVVLAGYSPDPVYLATGDFCYDHLDLNTGSGVFPYSLSFQRFYRSNMRLKRSETGLGWTHNHAITATVNCDPFMGMSTLNPIQGAAGLVQMFVTVDLYRDLTKPLDKWVAVALSNRWMLDQLMDNVVDVSFADGTQRFIKLPDGSYVSPLGSANSLTESLGAFTLTTPQGVRHVFNTDGKISSIEFPDGPVVTYTYTGSQLTSVANGMGRELTLTYVGDDLVDVADETTRFVSFTRDVEGNLTVVTDPELGQTTFEYDQPGRMTKIFKPANPTSPIVVNTYDTLNRVKEQADAYENVTRFFIAGSRTELEDPASNSEVYFYDGLQNIVKFIDKANKSWLYEFDGLARCVKTTAPEGNSTEYEYDGMNNNITVTHKAKPGSGLANIVFEQAFDPIWNKVISATNPRGITTSRTYDEVTGQLTTITRPEVNNTVATIEMRYNERGQLISHIDEMGKQTQFSYDALTEALMAATVNSNWLATVGGTITVSDVLTIIVHDVGLVGGTKSKSYTVVTGNTLGDVAAGLVDAINADSELSSLGITAKVNGEALALSTAAGNTTTFTHTSSGGATETINLEPGLNLTTTFGYDAVGNVESVTNPRGDETTFEYDGLRRQTKVISAAPFEYESRFTYDGNNNRIKVEKFAGLDELDEPIWQTASATFTLDDRLNTITDPANNVTEFSYDSRRQLLDTEDAASRVQARTYDEIGRLLTVTDPGSVVQAMYTYSDNGRVASVEDANGNVTLFEYDGFDRQKKKVFPDTSFEESTFDAFGRLESVSTRAGAVVSFEYDDLNRLIERSPDNMPVVSYEYDLVGRQKKVSTPVVSGNPASGDFEYFYDSAGRAIKEKYPDGKTVEYQFDELGNVSRFTYPDGFYVERVFDELNRLTDIKLNGSPTSALAFAFDPLSRRKKLTYENGVETDYDIDLNGNLRSLIQTFTGSSVEFTYGYNSVNELTSQAVDDSVYLWHPSSGVTKPYGAVNNLNQYASVDGNNFAYDDNGSLTDNDVWQFGYDTNNQLIFADDGVVTASYLYDPLGRQTQKTVNGAKTRYLHSGIRAIAEYNGTTGDLQKRFIHGAGIDEILLEIDDLGVVTSLHHDRIGSVIAKTDNTGTVEKSFAYSPWGECDDMLGITFGFQGQRYDHETGLYFMKARHYDPGIGRFLQSDPLGYVDSFNLYEFGMNNPNSFSDPLGLSADGSQGYAAGYYPGSDQRVTNTITEWNPTWEPTVTSAHQMDTNGDGVSDTIRMEIIVGHFVIRSRYEQKKLDKAQAVHNTIQYSTANQDYQADVVWKPQGLRDSLGTLYIGTAVIFIPVADMSDWNLVPRNQGVGPEPLPLGYSSGTGQQYGPNRDPEQKWPLLYDINDAVRALTATYEYYRRIENSSYPGTILLN